MRSDRRSLLACAAALALMLGSASMAVATDDPTPTPTAVPSSSAPTPTPTPTAEPRTPAPSPSPTQPAVPEDAFTVDDAQLRWGLNAESNRAAFNPGTYNFLSAGKIADPGRGGVTLT